MAFCDVGAGVLALAGLIKFFDPTPWVTSLGALGVPLGPVRFRRSVVAAARLVGESAARRALVYTHRLEQLGFGTTLLSTPGSAAPSGFLLSASGRF